MAQPVRILRISPAQAGRAAAWADALADFRPERATTLKAEAQAAVYRARLLSQDVVLKSWPVRGLAADLKLFLRSTRGHRHWRGAAWLARHGIVTAEPLALALDRPNGRLWLVMEAIPARSVLEHLFARDLGVRQEHAVARLLGQMVARLQGGGRFNRDGKPSNLLVGRGPDGAPVLVVIDCVAICPIIVARSDEPFGSLARLVIEALGTGIRVRRSLMMRVIRAYLAASTGLRRGARQRAKTRLIWDRTALFVQQHGDPRPRVNPLPQSTATAGAEMH